VHESGFCIDVNLFFTRFLTHLRAVRSVFSDEKKLSIAALSQTLPERLVEQTMPTPVDAWKECECAFGDPQRAEVMKRP
jgi:hypothetical protein